MTLLASVWLPGLWLDPLGCLRQEPAHRGRPVVADASRPFSRTWGLAVQQPTRQTMRRDASPDPTAAAAHWAGLAAPGRLQRPLHPPGHQTLAQCHPSGAGRSPPPRLPMNTYLLIKTHHPLQRC